MKDKFHSMPRQISLLYMGCPLTREHKQKKNQILIPKLSMSVYEFMSVHLRECVNTEFDGEIKRGFEKVLVSRAVHLREFPLAES